ncbi:hypothetical protein ACOYR1_00905 [Thalassotalea piscium]
MNSFLSHFFKFLALCLLFQSASVSAETINNNIFAPFSSLSKTIEGRHLLQLIDTAEYDPGLAKQQLNELAKTGIEAKNINYEVVQLLAYIAVHNGLSEFDITEDALNKLQALGIKLGNEWILGCYWQQRAVLALKQGQYLKGLDYTSQALKIAEALNFQELVARVKSIRAIFYSKQGKSTLALKDFQAALLLFKTMDDSTRVIKVHLNLVSLYLDRQEYSKALVAADTVADMLLAQPRKNIRAMAANYINRAIALSYLGEKDKELDAYKLAQEYAIRSNNVETLAGLYANLSNYYLKNKDDINAEHQAKRCIETALQIKNHSVVAICEINQGLASIHTGKTDIGFTLLNKAIATMETNKMLSSLAEGYLAIAEAYQYLNDYKSARPWVDSYYQLLLTQANEDKRAYYFEVERNLQESVADRDNTYTLVKNHMLSSILTQDNKINNILLWLGLTLLLLCISLGLNIYYRKKLKNKYT